MSIYNESSIVSLVNYIDLISSGSIAIRIYHSGCIDLPSVRLIFFEIILIKSHTQLSIVQYIKTSNHSCHWHSWPFLEIDPDPSVNFRIRIQKKILVHNTLIHYWLYTYFTMVLTLNGNLEKGAHVKSNLYYFICSTHLIRSWAVTNRIPPPKKKQFFFMLA